MDAIKKVRKVSFKHLGHQKFNDLTFFHIYLLQRGMGWPFLTKWMNPYLASGHCFISNEGHDLDRYLVPFRLTIDLSACPDLTRGGINDKESSITAPFAVNSNDEEFGAFVARAEWHRADESSGRAVLLHRRSVKICREAWTRFFATGNNNNGSRWWAAWGRYGVVWNEDTNFEDVPLGRLNVSTQDDLTSVLIKAQESAAGWSSFSGKLERDNSVWRSILVDGSNCRQGCSLRSSGQEKDGIERNDVRWVVIFVVNNDGDGLLGEELRCSLVCCHHDHLKNLNYILIMFENT